MWSEILIEARANFFKPQKVIMESLNHQKINSLRRYSFFCKFLS
jgi:hypothetical protein